MENIVEESAGQRTSMTLSRGVVRYSAPEQIERNDVRVTKNSDAYSFAMLILECITEKIPFHEFSRDAAVIHARITKRKNPARPDGPQERNSVSDELWGLMNRCWSTEPDDRPTMEHVHSFFLLNV